MPLAQFLCLSFYAICSLSIAIHYLSIYFRKTTPVLGRQARAILDWEKRIASTDGWILVILTFTFLPALLFPMILFAMGVKNVMPFRPFYVFFFQLNGALNPLLNFGRFKEMRIAVRNLFKCSKRVQVQSSLRNNIDNDNCSNSVNDSNGSNIILTTTTLSPTTTTITATIAATTEITMTTITSATTTTNS